MYILMKNGKSWTCPDSSIVTLARIQATDSDYDKEQIINEQMAVDYIKSQGFDIEKVKDPEPINEVPKHPNWFNRTHRDLYNKLFYQDIGRELTDAEKQFCTTMYHLEEGSVGLL